MEIFAPEGDGPVDDFWQDVGAVSNDPPNEVYAEGADQAFLDLWKTLREGLWRHPEAIAESDASSEVE